ncbi:superoxide dismutase [Agrobacterium rubi]|uniref:Superoxide dismutase n=1 Tax=Agrobacterium rubi TaxID=28099 RepID=A0AAE7URN8_9HYPH|nr:superoxide dismutase [Agrobacterium rubi]NTE88905.1 superoxide dismutase [Agrobacterium rubi]NTF04733.1 superoxide dismutase [Agrobacterium rubi]NTF10257.1 superoxide dismutase [Agrobacterium rubi]NTF21565.1 superoxide dismutase [Agrobacterium rubi]NTF28422.1 superoxide dismutase [Agrobacterium rubi]
MLMTRRAIMAATAATAAVTTLSAPSIAKAALPLKQPALPFAEDALAPHISAKTVALHYGKHHKAYFDKLNTLAKGTPYADMELDQIVKSSAGKAADKKIFNNAAQAWNHVAYWEQFTPGGPNRPEGKVADELNAAFGDYGKFIEKAVATSDEVFGTGWVWLTRDDQDKLALVGYEDGNNPVAVGRPAYLGIDIWEHAYYVDYENRKPEHIKAVLENLINWRVVGDKIA